MAAPRIPSGAAGQPGEPPEAPPPRGREPIEAGCACAGADTCAGAAAGAAWAGTTGALNVPPNPVVAFVACGVGATGVFVGFAGACVGAVVGGAVVAVGEAL